MVVQSEISLCARLGRLEPTGALKGTVARKVTLWLPQPDHYRRAHGGKQFNARHSYSNYQLFVIDTGQKIGKPKDVSD